jgi:alcohol dehydrogenase, propanol-preferring
MNALPTRYTAMALTQAGDPALHPIERETPAPGRGELLLRMQVCGVCRTDLHIADGELAPPRWPCVAGHEVVGRVVARGEDCRRFALARSLGVHWAGSSNEALRDADLALARLRAGQVTGAAVLDCR